MVRIRLWRMGAKKRPSYRVVVADSRSRRDGRIIENLGTYDPGAVPASVAIDQERARYWLSCGAQPSSTVQNLFQRVGVYRKES
ncbi:MAG: 30S ribosomal protein S16 [Nitrospinota bacterium]